MINNDGCNDYCSNILITIPEVCVFLGICQSTLNRLRFDPKFPKKVQTANKNQTFFLKAQITEWLENKINEVD